MLELACPDRLQHGGHTFLVPRCAGFTLFPAYPSPRNIKDHGCEVCCLENPRNYRPFVAIQTQIDGT